jgi:hypothetical protein
VFVCLAWVTREQSGLITHVDLGTDGSERSLIEEDSTERKLESMYLNISLFRYFLFRKFGVP